jgi:hypothetical protein
LLKLHPDWPELSEGYIANMRKRGQEAMASLSPQAQQIAKLIGKDLDEVNGTKENTSPVGRQTPRQEA